MNLLLFYLMVCGIAFYFGGESGIVLALIIVTIWCSINALSHVDNRHQTSLADHEQHRTDGMNHIYYVQDGQAFHESDDCSHCTDLYRDQLLQQEGVTSINILYQDGRSVKVK